MNILTGILSGFGEIWAHKLRSFLSLLSVFLGVASLIVIVGFINGLFTSWQVEMNEFGGVDIITVSEQDVPKKQQDRAKYSKGITYQDTESIAALTHNQLAYDAEIHLNQVILQANRKTYYVRGAGVTPGVFAVKRYEVQEGRILTKSDLTYHESVVVISQPVRKALFGARVSPLGQIISINGINFTVVGLLKNYSYMEDDYDLLTQKNHILFIPLTTCATLLKGSDTVDSLQMKVKDVDKIFETVQEIRNILIHTHEGLRDFEVSTNQDEIKSFLNIRNGFYTTGFAIGGITLIIGGVGIMNLMLASINERMREIGLRKAIGAANSDIFFQVLTESIILCSMGGLIGIALGFGIIPLLQLILKGSGFSPVFSWSSGVIGFVFSMLVGLVAGTYPAWKASRLDPIEALRYE